ncbi:ZGPAT [Cervus elaphus hippelaphus]|uniref:ZGPAT n=1 Tax=Cervus elaphus hippelaphus TaxID=46360 RepID=A0A212CAG7_CEREH|nr:ZGPAT [Cervus elaphus hippelaphus]
MAVPELCGPLCRFSHGQVVSVDELRPFQDPDLSSLQAGSACLAKRQDGLWYPAQITDVDSGYYTVKFDSLLLKEAVVEGDSILPPLRTEPAGSSDSDGSDADDPSYARVVEPGAANPGTCSSAFAGWEVHTRGIGSRLLAKMGYEFGKGLGRHAEGRVEPVHAVVLPRGKSLDQCAEILQKRTRGGQAGVSKPPKCRGRGGGAGGRPPPRSVFDFLNEKLKGESPGAPEVGAAPPGRSGKEVYHASRSTKRALSLRLLQTEEKIEQTQRAIRGIQEALARNAGRHSVTTAQLQEKLAGAQRQLGQLRAQEAGLQREQRKADTHKKMTEMRQQGSSVPPALWVLGCLTLLLWLWVLCTACNRKQARRQLSRLQGSAMPAEVSLLRRPHHCSLSKSDTRLHELHRSRPCSRAPRPASMDLLRPQYLEASRGMTRPPAPFSHQELPLAAPSTGLEATYSNVGLATIPRARLAVSSGVWAGARLTSSYARPGPEARPVVAEYACVQKLRGTDRGPQGLGQGKVEATPATQVDILYSRVNKPKRRDPGPATDQPDPKGGGAILALGSDPAYEVLPLGGLGMDKSLLENVYESIQDMGATLEPPSSSSYQERTAGSQ